MTGAERWTFVPLRWLSTISAIVPSGSGSTRAIWPTCPGNDNKHRWPFCTSEQQSFYFLFSRILLFEHSLCWHLWLVYFWSFISFQGPEVEFLDKIQTKVLRVSSLLFTVTSAALLEISISSNSRNLLQFLLRRKEGNLIENHSPERP